MNSCSIEATLDLILLNIDISKFIIKIWLWCCRGNFCWYHFFFVFITVFTFLSYLRYSLFLWLSVDSVPFFRVIAYPLINLNLNDVEQNDEFWDQFQVLEGRSAQNIVLFNSQQAFTIIRLCVRRCFFKIYNGSCSITNPKKVKISFVVVRSLSSTHQSKNHFNKNLSDLLFLPFSFIYKVMYAHTLHI